LNQGKGGFKHLSVDANGKASWGYWSEVTTRAVDAAGKESWSYTDTEWHFTLIGDLTFRNGMLGVDTGGVLRDFNGNIITGGERPIEMQMLGPADYLGAGEFKAGASLAAALGAGSLRGLLKSATTGATARLTQKGLEHIVERHWATSGAQGAGKFAVGTSLKDLKSMINQTISHPGIIRPNTNGRPGIIYELSFGRTIGTNISGGAASNLRVVVGPNGTVITAFPF
jgi:hypothetical protein